MKLYLDDERPTPDGWTRTYTVDETIYYLKSRKVNELSLDNDLGECMKEGYEVLNWLEEEVFNDDTFPIPVITIHSSNAARVQSMTQCANKLKQIRMHQYFYGTGDKK